jgi:hypothetical protein
MLISVQKQKSLARKRREFFCVDNELEISNHDLIRDMDKVIKLEEVYKSIYKNTCHSLSQFCIGYEPGGGMFYSNLGE